VDHAELYQTAELLAATATRLDHEAVPILLVPRWPVDPKVFGRVATALFLSGNTVAARFNVRGGTGGGLAHDWDDLLRVAADAGFITYLAPAYTQFMSLLSTEEATRMLAKHSEARRIDAVALMRALRDAGE
jgi:hypothetical protein